MSFTDRTFFLAAFKKLQGSAHTDNTKEPFNEPLASQVLITASQIIGEEVSPNPVTASGASIIEHIVADLELDPTSNNLSYRAKFPTGYTGTFGAGVVGEFVSEYTFAISPGVVGGIAPSTLPVTAGGYAIDLKDNGSTVAAGDTTDWFFDYFNTTVTSEDALSLGSTGTADLWIYTGNTALQRLNVLASGITAASGVTDINTVSGSITIEGAGEVAVTTVGQTITISGTDHTAAGGDGAVSDAMVGADGITVISGVPTSSETTISGFRTEFVNASGSLQSTIDAIPSNTDTVSDALTGSDGITVASGSNTTDIAGFRTEFVSASGALQTDIDAIDDHARYTDGEAISALEPTTSALAASGVATDVNVAINTTNISILTTSGIAQDVLIAANTSLITTTSGHLQSEIDTTQPDVDSLNSLTGDVTVVGKGEVGVTVEGQNIVVSGTDHAASINTDTVSDALIGGTDITVTSGSNITTIDWSGVDNDTVSDALTGSDGITIASGSNTTDIAGFQTEFVSASGSLQSQIDTVDTNTDDVSDALIGGTDITVTSGSNITTIDWTGVDNDTVSDALIGGTDITVTSGSNIVTIDWSGTDTDTVSDALIGADGITVASGSDTTTLTGFRTEFVNASGSLQSEIDNIPPNTDTISDALTGSDGITVTSGSNTTDIAGFRNEFLSASGTFVRKTGDVMTGDLDITAAQLIIASGTSANPGLIFDGVSNTGLRYDPTADAISFINSGFPKFSVSSSGVVTIPRFLSSNGIVSEPQYSFLFHATTGMYITTLGYLGFSKDGILALEIDDDQIVNAPVGLTVSGVPVDIGDNQVNSLNSLIEDVTVIGKGEVGVTVEGQSIVVSGTDHTAGGGGGTVSDALIGADGITVTSGSNTTTLTGFLAEFVSASGSLQSDIDAIPANTDTVSDALTGSDGITVVSGSNTTDIAGFRAEFVSASGALSAEIDSDIATHAGITDAHHIRYTQDENDAIIGGDDITVTSGSNIITVDFTGTDNDTVSDALIGTDGITVTSGSNTTTLTGFYNEFVSASGTFLKNVVEDLTPQLGGNLDVNNQSIISTGEDINIQPGGTGGIELFTGDMSGNAASRSIWMATSGGGSISLDTYSNSNTGPIYISSGDQIVIETINNQLLHIHGAGSLTIEGDTSVKLESTAGQILFTAGLWIKSTNARYLSPSWTAAEPTYSFTNTDGSGMFAGIGPANRYVGISNTGTLVIAASGLADGTPGIGVAGDITTSGTVAASSGIFATGLTVSGIPVNLEGGGTDTNDVSNALVGSDGITVTSGVSTDTVSGFYAEFVSASGSLQSEIDATQPDVDAITVSGGADITGTIDFVGSNGVNVSAAGNTVTFDGLGVASGGLKNVVEDLTPQLGGDLDVNGNIITSAASNVNIQPGGTNAIQLYTGKYSGTPNAHDIRLTTSGDGQILLDTFDNTGDINIQSGGNLNFYTNNVGQILFQGDGFVDINGDKRVDVTSVTQNVRIQSPLELTVETPIRASNTQTESAPAYSFTADTDTGMWRKTVNVVGIGGGGREILTISGSLGVQSGEFDGIGVDGNATISGTVRADVGTFLTSLTVSGIPVNLAGGSGGAVDSVNSVTGNVTIAGNGNTSVNTAGQTITISSPSSNALVGSDGITVTSGSPTDTISGFYSEFVSASGLFVEKAGDTMTGDLFMDDANLTAHRSTTGAGAKLVVPSGSFTELSIHFEDDSNTGFSSAAADAIYVLAGGTLVNVFAATGAAYFAPALFNWGNVAAPGLSFFTDDDTGIARTATNAMTFATAGIGALTVDANQITTTHSGIVANSDTVALTVNGTTALNDDVELTTGGQLTVPSGTSGAPSIIFNNDPNTGIWSSAADTFSFNAGGALALSATSDSVTMIPQIRGFTGNAITPQFSHFLDWDSGVYRAAGDTWGMSTGGISAFEITPNQIITVPSGLTVSGLPVLIHPYTKDNNDAIIGGENLTVTSGSNIITVDGSTLTKSISVESPSDAEDISWFFTPVAITVTEVTSVSVGTTPSTTISVMHNTNRSSAGNNVLTAATATTSTSTGDNPAIGGDTTIPLDSFVWLETSAQTGTVTNLLVSLTYTED